MANVLVTGGAGFIGSRVVKKLLEDGHHVTVVDNLSKKGDFHEEFKSRIIFKKIDLCNREAVRGLLDNQEYCFHFAALIGGIGYFNKIPADILRDNFIMHANLLEEARTSKKFKKFIYMSSSMVFERTEKFPSKEEDIFTSPPPVTHYGMSKLVGEYLCRSYFDQYGIKFTIFRPFNAYGPGEIPEQEVGIAHVIPDLIRKVCFDRQYPVEILGQGDQVRSYTYVDDIAEAVATLSFDERTDNDSFNVANPDPYTVIEILERIWELAEMGKELRIKHLPAIKHDVLKRIPDTEKISRLGWEPKISLNAGLKITYDWILNNAK